MCFKQEFHLSQFNRKDERHFCKVCVERKTKEGTPYECRKCFFWKAAEAFDERNLARHHCRICQDCVERRQCRSCKEEKEQELKEEEEGKQKGRSGKEKEKFERRRKVLEKEGEERAGRRFPRTSRLVRA